VEAQAVPKIESTLGVGTGTGTEDLTHLLPKQEPPGAPPVDNDHVAPGCEKFDAPVAVSKTANNMVKYQPPSMEGFEGEWGGEDVKFPQLKLVQGSGPLSQQFDAGTVIYGEVELLPPASVKEGVENPTLRFVPISISKQWREKLGQDEVASGLMPRVVKTVAEIEELGGTTRWVGDTKPDNFWEPSARCILLIEQPEGSDHAGFGIELDGKQFGVAVYYAAGIAYRDSAQRIFNTAMTSLLVPVMNELGKPLMDGARVRKRPLLYKNFWRLGFAKKTLKNSSFTPWEPVVKLLPREETGPDVRAYCETILRNSAEVAEAAAPAD
jgi:hypothetical protein